MITAQWKGLNNLLKSASLASYITFIRARLGSFKCLTLKRITNLGVFRQAAQFCPIGLLTNQVSSLKQSDVQHSDVTGQKDN